MCASKKVTLSPGRGPPPDPPPPTMAASSSPSSATAVTRLAVSVAAVGVAAYAYHRLTRVARIDGRSADGEPSVSYAKPSPVKTTSSPAKTSSLTTPAPVPVPLPQKATAVDPTQTVTQDDPVAASLAKELAEAFELDARDAATFETRSDVETRELQRQAAVQMARLSAAGNMGADLANGGMRTLTPEECGGTTEWYSWTQTEREIVVAFMVPQSVTSKNVTVKIDTKTVMLAVNTPEMNGRPLVMLNGTLIASVVPDECVWEMEADPRGGGKKVSVTLHKLRPTMASHHWPCVVVGEPRNDTSKFGPPVLGINGNDPNALSRVAETMRHSSAGSWGKVES